VHLWAETVVLSIKIESSQQIFEKYSKIKFHEYPSTGKPMFSADGQTDRHEEAKW